MQQSVQFRLGGLLNPTPESMTDEEKREKARLYARAWRAANPDKRAANERKYREANKEKVREAHRRYREASKDKAAAWHRENKYGITQEQFDAMLEAQNFSCAICGSTKPGGTGGFHVDHCHASGAVRGLLCRTCNIGLGNFRDSPTHLMRAIEYVTAQGNHHGPSEIT